MTATAVIAFIVFALCIAALAAVRRQLGDLRQCAEALGVGL